MSLDDKPLLLFFTHRTSGPARKMESQLAQVAHKERERLRVSAIDVAESPELTDRLGVTQVPTLILFKDRKPIERLEGSVSSAQIGQMLSPHLAPPDTT